MSDRVSADIEGLRRLRREIDRAQQTVQQAVSQLKAGLANAAWDDSARQAFEAQLMEAAGSANQFLTRTEALKPILGRKIAALEAFLRS